MEPVKHPFETLQENAFTAASEKLGKHVSVVAEILSKIHTAQQKSRTREIKQLSTGNSVMLNFSAQSVYIDNSRGVSSATLTPSNGLISFSVAAGAQQWVHPLGGRDFEFDGGDNVPCMFVDEFIPIK